MNECRYTGNHEGRVDFIVHEGAKRYAACKRHAQLKAAAGLKVDDNTDTPQQPSLFDPKKKSRRRKKT
jgi:hypothetical protein